MKSTTGLKLALAGLALLVLMVFSTGGSLGADTVYYTDGTSQEGTVVYEDEKEVWIDVITSGGKARVKVPRDTVAKIVKGKTKAQRIMEMYENRLEDINMADHKDWYKLGLWCEQFKLLSQKARESFEKAIQLEPDFAPAHLKLGHVRHEGVWMTHEDMMRSRGYVKYRGKWMTVEDKMALVLKEKELQIVRERRRLQEAEARRLLAEAELEKARKQPREVVTRTERVIVREQVVSPLWYGGYVKPRVYVDHRGPYVSPYYVRYPYRRGWYRPARCGSVHVSYTKRTDNSRLHVGFSW